MKFWSLYGNYLQRYARNFFGRSISSQLCQLDLSFSAVRVIIPFVRNSPKLRISLCYFLRCFFMQEGYWYKRDQRVSSTSEYEKYGTTVSMKVHLVTPFWFIHFDCVLSFGGDTGSWGIYQYLVNSPITLEICQSCFCCKSFW